MQSHIAAARKAAGEQWQVEADFFCGTPRANRPDDPLLEPTRIFDNVSVIGRRQTAVNDCMVGALGAIDTATRWTRANELTYLTTFPSRLY